MEVQLILDIQPNRMVIESLALGMSRSPTEAAELEDYEQPLEDPGGEQAGVPQTRYLIKSQFPKWESKAIFHYREPAKKETLSSE